MAAVLRVKRRNDDEPLNALILACKRRKTTEEDGDELSGVPLKTIVKFAGTVKNQGDDVVEHLVKTLWKDDLKSSFKNHAIDVLNKMRQETKQSSVENRYKVVSCLRSLNTSNIEEFEDKIMTVIDVEDSVSCTAKQDSAKIKDDAYVYDLYYGQTEEGRFDVDNSVSVHALDQELVFDMQRNASGRSENDCESEDSNSESNWKNDYPDSDHSERSVNEEDMVEAVRDLRLEEGSDLSSEDDFVYAVDEFDIEQHGYKYAKYKARIKEEMGEDNSEHSSIYVSEIEDSDASEKNKDETDN